MGTVLTMLTVVQKGGEGRGEGAGGGGTTQSHHRCVLFARLIARYYSLE